MTVSSDANTSAPISRTVAIDASVWLPAKQIRWPSSQRGVLFTTDFGAVKKAVGESELSKVSFRPEKIYMGSYNGRLIVFANQLKFPRAQLYEDFLAEHESFHIAAQYFGQKTDTEILSTSMHLADLSPRVQKFWRTTLAISSGNGAKPKCKTLTSAYNSLTPEQKLFVRVRSYWEWPAEYYSRKKVLPHLSQSEYVKFRDAIAGDNLPYISGSTAFNALDRLVGKKVWQFRIANGEHPLNVYAMSLGCKPLFESGFALPVSDLKFGETDEGPDSSDVR